MQAESPYVEVTIGKEVLRIGGFAELSARNGKSFQNQVCAALNGHTVVEIDLSRTTFLDCAGVGALIAVRNLARRRNGVVRLVNPTSPVKQLLDLVRAGEIFEIVHHPEREPSECLTLAGRYSSAFPEFQHGGLTPRLSP